MMNTVVLDKKGISINGEHKVLLCASLFYFRLAKEEWQERIDDIISAGYNCIDVYFPWNFHETEPNVWDFSGDKDANLFLKMATESGLYIIARPGPYICSEWDGGALPAFITANTNIRTNDAEFLAESKKWFDKILPIIKKYETKGLGGVILLQLENELDFFDCSDVKGYISALREMALEKNIEVPLFCCAGQKGANEAGGFVDGIVPTYNFYPDSKDNTFDKVMTYYNDALAQKDLPLLISETNRDHFLLRRELASGAKLLGAYNQVAGSNFGFTSSVNNWGKPLAFISTLYDFGSLITTMGEYSEEIDNARIFARVINVLGEKLAKATLYKGDITYKSDFVTLPNLNALKLDGGGVLVNLPNFSDKDGNITVTVLNKTISAYVKALTAPFVIFDTEICGNLINSANCELIDATDKKLVFCSDKQGEVEINGKKINSDGIYGGVEVVFINSENAAVYGLNNPKRAAIKHNEIAINKVKIYEDYFNFDKVESGDKLNFEALKIWRGYGQYLATTEINAKIFLENVSDIVTAYIDKKYVDTRIGTGTCIVYPPSVSGKSCFRVEKWGQSNFDDSRLKSIRIAAKKGIENIYSVIDEVQPTVGEFKLLDDFMTENIDISNDGFMPLLGVSAWNTTKMPAICAYSFKATRLSDKLYISTTTEVENAVYVNGKLVGRGDYEFNDLTYYAPLNKEITVTVVYRKLNWAVDCKAVTIYQLKKAITEVGRLTETMISNMRVEAGEDYNLPHYLAVGKTYKASVKLATKKSCYISANLKDCKITFVIDNKVVARLFGKSEITPTISGGSDTDFYIPAAWLNKDSELLMYIECIGKNPIIESLTIKEKNN